MMSTAQYFLKKRLMLNLSVGSIGFFSFKKIEIACPLLGINLVLLFILMCTMTSLTFFFCFCRILNIFHSLQSYSILVTIL